jgi:hypothetical protein
MAAQLADWQSQPVTRLIRIATITLAAGLVISGLTQASGGWHLGEQCVGVSVMWATTTTFSGAAARCVGYLIGAALVVHPVGLGWTAGFAPAATVTVIVLAAFGAEDTQRRRLSIGGVPIVFVWSAVSLGAIYACVPETDHIRWLALAVGVLVVGEFVLGEPSAPGLASAAVAVVGWAVLYGGHTRDSAVIGGLGAFGLLLIEPLSNVGSGNAPRIRFQRAVGALALVALQAGGTLAIARGGGLRATRSAALVMVVALLGAMAVVCRLIVSVCGLPAPAPVERSGGGA